MERRKAPSHLAGHGSDEGNSPQMMIQDARALRDGLVAKSWSEGDDLQYREVRGAQHNEFAWARVSDRFWSTCFPLPELSAQFFVNLTNRDRSLRFRKTPRSVLAPVGLFLRSASGTPALYIRVASSITAFSAL